MDTWKIRVAFGLVLTFVYSAYLAVGELRYALMARTAQARLVGKMATRDIGASGRSRPAVGYEYTFQDGPTTRTERDLVPSSWDLDDGDTIEVQYIAGEEGASRLAGHRELGGVYFFLVCLAVMSGFLWKLIREAKEPIRPRSGRRPT